MEFMIEFLCQITETEPKTAMAGPARNIARRTRRNKPTNHHLSGGRRARFCDNSLIVLGTEAPPASFTSVGASQVAP